MRRKDREVTDTEAIKRILDSCKTAAVAMVEFIEDLEEKKKAIHKMFAQQAGQEVAFTDEQAACVCVFKIVSRDFTGKQKSKM